MLRPPRIGAAIAGWELTRLGRRGTPTTARLMAVGLVFAALFVTYLAAFPQDLSTKNPDRNTVRLAEFGSSFALVFLIVQSSLVILVTPLFVAGTIVEETERRTLEFLLATDLYPREIVLGKLWSRLLLVVGLIVAGWPVLIILQVWGGVDVAFIGIASAIILAQVIAVAGISAACSVGTTTLKRSMIKAYGWSLVLQSVPVLTCPIYALFLLDEVFTFWPDYRVGKLRPRSAAEFEQWVLFLVGYAAAQFALGTLGIWRACRKLRKFQVLRAKADAERTRPREKWERHPPVPDTEPLTWKEVYLSGQTSRFVRSLNLLPWWAWLGLSVSYMAVGLGVLADTAGESWNIPKVTNGIVRWGGGGLVALMCLAAGLHAAGSVARERQQETLTDLLMIPGDRAAIVWAKWRGSISKARGIAIGAGAIPLLAALVEGVHPLAVPLLFLAAFSLVACSASFGLWLSVRSATVQRATGYWLLLAVLWVGGTMLASGAIKTELERRDAGRAFVGISRAGAGPLTEGPGYDSTDYERLVHFDRAVNPVAQWFQLAFVWEEAVNRWGRRSFDEYAWLPNGVVKYTWHLAAPVYGIAFFAGLACIFYRLARWRFEAEGRSA